MSRPSFPRSPGSSGRQLFSRPQGRRALGGLARHRNLLCGSGSRLGRRWPLSFNNSRDSADHRRSGCGQNCLCGLGQGRFHALPSKCWRGSISRLLENPLRRLRRGGGSRTTSVPVLTRWHPRATGLLTPKFGKESDLWVQFDEESVW
jgi:hypothetical protein